MRDLHLVLAPNFFEIEEWRVGFEFARMKRCIHETTLRLGKPYGFTKYFLTVELLPGA